MGKKTLQCVLLADRHHGLTEGVRGLLETVSSTVVMVADEPSLFESVERLQPTMAVVDLSLTRGKSLQWLPRLRAKCPSMKLVLISIYDEPSVCRAAMEAGAEGFVVKHAIAGELLSVVDSVMAGHRFVSAGVFNPPSRSEEDKES